MSTTRSGATSRPVTEVAVGVLIRADGAVLLADRPAGKPYAGYWEFPGGKIESGETLAAALARELHEELGLDIGAALPWVTFEFDYPHAYVRLHFCRVFQWRGEPHPHEGQRLGFFSPHESLPVPLLPAAVPAMRWLKLPRTILRIEAHDAATPPASVERALSHGAAWPWLSGPQNRSAPIEAAALSALARAHGAQLIADFAAGAQPGIDAVVLEPAMLAQADQRPAYPWVGARVNTAAALARAAALQFDFAVVGPVKDDSTAHGASPIGWAGFQCIVENNALPVYATGSLALTDEAIAIAHGAHGLVVALD